MKTIVSSVLKFLIVVAVLTLSQSCTQSSDHGPQTGETEFKITNNPLDDANIRGVFITVSDIKVNDNSVAGFQRQTINLKDFEDGNTKSMATTLLAAIPHSDLTLVLDAGTDDKGQSPGCYVTTFSDDIKYALSNEQSINIGINTEWNVNSNKKSAVVIDFDIRKAIVQVEDPAIRYAFASLENLQGAARILDEKAAGMIMGNFYSAEGVPVSRVIVYVYKKSSFNPTTEIEPQGEDKTLFRNAVTSTELVEGPISKVFKLDFLKEGDYQLYFATYTTGDYPVFTGILNTEITSGETSAGVVAVPAGWTANVIVMAK
ncbi:hypothetical protein BH10BAC4_BH10BAC4_22120 [soil metagenome]